MKRIAFAFLILSASVAFAADKTPAAPTCGKTADECEKKVVDLQSQLQRMTTTAQGYRQLLATAQATNADSQIAAFVQQQTAVAEKK